MVAADFNPIETNDLTKVVGKIVLYIAIIYCMIGLIAGALGWLIGL